MKTLKELLAKLLNFTTGLGFYGIGLLAVAAVFYFWFEGAVSNYIASGLVGAFIFKNYESVVKWINTGIDAGVDAIQEKF